MAKREEWVEKMKGQLDEWNEDIAGLERKLGEMSAPMRAKLEPQLAKLKEGYGSAKAKVGEVKAAGEESWEGLTGEVEHVWKTLRKSINYFKSQL